MRGLAAKRCFNHELREAVCRCPDCRNFFCGECVVLFESRLLCAACLAQASEGAGDATKTRFGAGAIVLAVFSFVIAWVLLYLAGWTILEFRDRAPVAETGSLGIERLA